MDIKKPPFINFPGNIVFNQPVAENYTQIYGFTVQGDVNALQKLIDQRLNFMDDRPNTKYFVVSDKVLFSFTTSVDGHSTGSDIGLGYSGEVAFLTFITLVKCNLINGVWEAQEILLFLPYAIVDNPFSMAVGRETYGFPKTIGVFTVPTDTNFIYNFSVSTLAFNKFNEEARSYIQPLININREISNDPQEVQEISDSKVIWEKLKGQMKPSNDDIHYGLKFYATEIENIINGEIPLVFLKQLRDVADGSKAGYQAIIEANGKIDAFRGASIYSSNFIVSINPLDSFPIASDLGVPSVSAAEWAYRVEIDLSFGNGVEVYRSI